MVEPVVVPCATPEAWHAERAKGIGASEVAALFGAHPYLTKLQLWARKKEGLADTQQETEAMEAGHFAELMLAPWYAKRTGRKVLTPQEFYGAAFNDMRGFDAHQVIVRHPALPLQCTPDRIMSVMRDGGASLPGVLQLKNADRFLLDQWEGEEGEPKVPLHVQLQVQAEMMCTGLAWGSVACVIGGNRMRYADVEADTELHAVIAAHAGAFWASLAGDESPAPAAGDLEMVKARWPMSAPGLVAEVRPELVVELARVRAMKSTLESMEKQLSATLLDDMKDAELGISNGKKLCKIINVERNEQPREARTLRFRQINIDAEIRNAVKAAALPASYASPELPAR